MTHDSTPACIEVWNAMSATEGKRSEFLYNARSIFYRVQIIDRYNLIYLQTKRSDESAGNAIGFSFDTKEMRRPIDDGVIVNSLYRC